MFESNFEEKPNGFSHKVIYLLARSAEEELVLVV